MSRPQRLKALAPPRSEALRILVRPIGNGAHARAGAFRADCPAKSWFEPDAAQSQGRPLVAHRLPSRQAT